MNLENEALMIAQTLADGSVTRMTCPACLGGDKREASWVVGREANRVWYKCFRASCAVSGVAGAESLPPGIKAELDRALARIRPYTRPVRPFGGVDRTYFWERFEVDVGEWRGGLTDDDEYVLKVRGPHGDLRGVVVRQPVWKGTPKAPRKGREGLPKTVLYPASSKPMLAWYPHSVGFSHVVLVEDQISAMKVAQQTHAAAVALLGNGINAEGVRDILKVKPRVVTIALDPGAEGQAQNIARKWGLYFERTRVVMLEADPKDIPADDLAEELGL